MRRIAVITARGGSKRIPRKNIKNFLGKPIITYSIESALNSGVFDVVMVSTDDVEIAEIAKNIGAEVPFMRSAESANDFATTADVLNEVLSQYAQIGEKFDTLCCIYPTAPFVTADKLCKAVELIEEKKVDTVFPVVQYSFPPQRALVIRQENVSYLHPEHTTTRSQDLEPLYHDCGQFYCVNVESFLKSGKVIGEVTLPIITDEMEVQDIDNITDWKLAEVKYKLMLEGK